MKNNTFVNSGCGTKIIYGFLLAVVILIFIQCRYQILDKYFFRKPSKVGDLTENPNKTIEYLKDRRNHIETVIFIPGWLTQFTSQKEQEDFLKVIYPNAKVITKKWGSLRTWNSAIRNTQSAADNIGEFLQDDPQIDLTKTVIAGHSLGGRIAVYMAEKLKTPVDHVVLLGAAIDYDDSFVKNAGAYKETEREAVPCGGSTGPYVCVCHENDDVLNTYYAISCNKQALGHSGPSDDSLGMIVLPVLFSQEPLPVSAAPDSTDDNMSMEEAFELLDPNNEEANRALEIIDQAIDEAVRTKEQRETGLPIAAATPAASAATTHHLTQEEAKELKLFTDQLGLGLSEEDFIVPSTEPKEGQGQKLLEAGAGISDVIPYLKAIKIFTNIKSHSSCQYLKCYQKELEK